MWSIVCSNDAALLEKTEQVMRWMRSLFQFGECVLFSSIPSSLDSARVVRCPTMGLTELNIFVLRTVPSLIKTQFAMSVHEDGFATNASMWTDEFLSHDYIGAPWPDGVVGNGGFCIESKRFVDAKQRLSDDGLFGPWSENESVVSNTTPSDVFVCRTRRADLESMGMRWAPCELSARFSTEQTHKGQKSLGFHGRIAAKEKYDNGWEMINSWTQSLSTPIR